MINKIIKAWRDGTCIGYGKGRFDNYCVYIKENGVTKIPKDVDYFTQIRAFADKYSEEQIFNHMLILCSVARRKKLDVTAFTILEILPGSYDTEDQLQINKLFYTLFLTMYAEEYKEGTKLGSLIKAVGIHELLFSGRSICDAANFMRGMCYGRIVDMVLNKDLLEQIEKFGTEIKKGDFDFLRADVKSALFYFLSFYHWLKSFFHIYTEEKSKVDKIRV